MNYYLYEGAQEPINKNTKYLYKYLGYTDDRKIVRSYIVSNGRYDSAKNEVLYYHWINERGENIVSLYQIFTLKEIMNLNNFYYNSGRKGRRGYNKRKNLRKPNAYKLLLDKGQIKEIRDSYGVSLRKRQRNQVDKNKRRTYSDWDNDRVFRARRSIGWKEQRKKQYKNTF